MMVPAQADIVIEAEMSYEEVAIEAPFGEYTQYYGGQRLNPVTEVKAITQKEGCLLPGHHAGPCGPSPASTPR